jgi:hypothetical protein
MYRVKCGSILTARRGSRLIYDYWIWKNFPRPELSISCNRQDAFTHTHRHNNKRHIRPPSFSFSLLLLLLPVELLMNGSQKRNTRRRNPFTLKRNICLGNRAADAGPGIWPLWWLFRIINQKKRNDRKLVEGGWTETSVKKYTQTSRKKKKKSEKGELPVSSFFSVWVARTVGAASYAQ